MLFLFVFSVQGMVRPISKSERFSWKPGFPSFVNLMLAELWSLTGEYKPCISTCFALRFPPSCRWCQPRSTGHHGQGRNCPLAVQIRTLAILQCGSHGASAAILMGWVLDKLTRPESPIPHFWIFAIPCLLFGQAPRSSINW